MARLSALGAGDGRIGATLFALTDNLGCDAIDFFLLDKSPARPVRGLLPFGYLPLAERLMFGLKFCQGACSGTNYTQRTFTLHGLALSLFG
jgi:hypothetical protein